VFLLASDNPTTYELGLPRRARKALWSGRRAGEVFALIDSGNLRARGPVLPRRVRKALCPRMSYGSRRRVVDVPDPKVTYNPRIHRIDLPRKVRKARMARRRAGEMLAVPITYAAWVGILALSGWVLVAVGWWLLARLWRREVFVPQNAEVTALTFLIASASGWATIAAGTSKETDAG